MAATRGGARTSDDGSDAYDVYLCHASEDQAGFVEPLAAALEDRGLRVRLDRQQIQRADDCERR